MPIRAVHVEAASAQVSVLKVFVAVEKDGDEYTVHLVDITNPSDRRLTGEFDGDGYSKAEALRNAIADWTSDNRYPPGLIKLEVPTDVLGRPHRETFQTDGSSFWDSVADFFATVGFWTGMGAIAAGVVTALTPIPGSRAVSGLIWASIITTSTAAAINIAQRHSEKMASPRHDAIDVLTIGTSVLSGVWMKGATVLLAKGAQGERMAKAIVIGQFGGDIASGVLLSVDYIEEYDQIQQISDPQRRTDQMLELLQRAALHGGMMVLSMHATRSDLDAIGLSKAKFDTARLGRQGETIDTSAPPRQDVEGDGRTRQDGETPGRGRADSEPEFSYDASVWNDRGLGATISKAIEDAEPGLRQRMTDTFDGLQAARADGTFTPTKSFDKLVGKLADSDPKRVSEAFGELEHAASVYARGDVDALQVGVKKGHETPNQPRIDMDDLEADVLYMKDGKQHLDEVKDTPNAVADKIGAGQNKRYRKWREEASDRVVSLVVTSGQPSFHAILDKKLLDEWESVIGSGSAKQIQIQGRSFSVTELRQMMDEARDFIGAEMRRTGGTPRDIMKTYFDTLEDALIALGRE